MRWASKQNSRVYVLPELIDTDRFTPQPRLLSSTTVRIGWMGAPWSIEKELVPIEPIIKRIVRRHPNVSIVIISSYDFRFSDASIPVENIRWSAADEAESLNSVDIGLLYLEPTEYNQARESSKIKSYMACGLPFVCSPVGENQAIMTRSGENCFVASTDEEWEKALSRLITDKPCREEMGRRGRRYIEREYSIRRGSGRFVKYLEAIHRGEFPDSSLNLPPERIPYSIHYGLNPLELGQG